MRRTDAHKGYLNDGLRGGRFPKKASIRANRELRYLS